MPVPKVDALLFDVQGTATDFYSTVKDAIECTCPTVDADALVTRWRAAYFDAVAATPTDGPVWTTVHSLYRRTLADLLPDFGVALDGQALDDLARAWQTLRPWPDAVPGLTRLRTRYTLATLSNADVSAVVRISKLGGLPWDAIFTAEMARAFKPSPATYAMAATYLGLPPSRIMMVASHTYDIRAPRDLGFATAFVHRPLEFGAHGRPDVADDGEFDLHATDFIDLAAQLGC